MTTNERGSAATNDEKQRDIASQSGQSQGKENDREKTHEADRKGESA